MKISVNFKTQRKPSEAFAFIAENFFQNHQKWDPELIENTKLTPGPIGVETKGRAVTKFAGKQVSDFEVTEYLLGQRFVFVNTTGPVNLERSYFFKQLQNGGTDINFIFEMKPKALPIRIVFPAIGVITKKRVHTNIKILESLLKKAK